MKATLITGASSGIGEAFARRLAAEKHNLVLVARSENKLHELCDELMIDHQIIAHYVAIDLIEFEADQQLFDETERHGLEIEWLINNAGYGSMGNFAGLELENELEMIGLNVMALVALTHRYLQKMRERRSGVIINVASTAGFQPVPFMATYAATKAFVRSFSEAIAEENRLFNITVTALCPGPTETNFFSASKIGTNAQDAFMKKGMQTPEEVVEAALTAVNRGKSTVISGWTNRLTARLGNLVPNSLITRAVGSVLRPKFEGKKQIESASESQEGFLTDEDR
jgi:short-subunit dehydrogenase